MSADSFRRRHVAGGQAARAAPPWKSRTCGSGESINEGPSVKRRARRWNGSGGGQISSDAENGNRSKRRKRRTKRLFCSLCCLLLNSKAEALGGYEAGACLRKA